MPRLQLPYAHAERRVRGVREDLAPVPVAAPSSGSSISSVAAPGPPPSSHRSRLASAIRASVVSPLLAERAPAYLEILETMLALRREHELEPPGDDLFRALPSSPIERDPEGFERDLARLTAWGCLERRVEPMRVRGYKDVRRERYRYRLAADAVALLEWLEGRAATRHGRSGAEGRDLLTDVLARARELARLCDRWVAGERDEGDPRRALHLVAAIDEGVHALGSELIGSQARMIEFACATYDAPALRAILGWLERYVSIHLPGIRALREPLVRELEALAQEERAAALSACHARMLEEDALLPPALRAGPPAHGVDDALRAAGRFFGSGERDGRLFELCTRIEESAREVLRKMHRHLRDLERRSTRMADLRAAVAIVGRAPDDPEALAGWLGELVASAHARPSSIEPGVRPPPPTMRRRGAASAAPTRPLRPKRGTPESARALRGRKLDELATWLDHGFLADHDETTLEEVARRARRDDEGGHDQLPARWIAIARARHLGRARDLAALGVTIAPAPGTVILGGPARGLEAGNATVRRRAR